MSEAAAAATPASPATDAPQQAQGTATATQTQGTTQASVQQAQANTAQAPAQAAAYAFKAPEGVTYDQTLVDAYSKAAQKLNLPQDAAQKLLDDVYSTYAERQAQQQMDLRAQWETEVKNDPDIGGQRLEENLATARRALEAFGSPELVQLLDVTGLGNNKHIISAFIRAGQAISTDRFVAGGNPTGKGQSRGMPDFARALYPNQG